MTRLYQMIAGSVACCSVFAQAALAGDYSSLPVVEDNASDAGLALLFAVGALLLIRAIATPKPTPSAEFAAETTE
jgi:hypothetical protein